MTDLPRITPADNGPLIVENPPPMTGTDGTPIEPRPRMALCRCGGSANKPFCDGTHNRIGFDSTLDHSRLRNTPVDYEGTVEGVAVRVSYTPVLCTHAAQCQARAASVFDPQKKPWVQPENGTLAEILDVIAACPSGALRVSVGGRPERHLTSGDVGIEIQRNGPYHVTNVTLAAEFNGVGASRAKYSLCRCGLSRNKPFCDGTHHGAAWSDEAPAPSE